MQTPSNELQAPSPPSQHSPEHQMFGTTCGLIQLGLGTLPELDAFTDPKIAH